MDIGSNAAAAIANGFARFEKASGALTRAVSGASDEDPGAAIVGQIEAKAQVQAGVAMLRMSEEMFRALLETQTD